jgi:NAD(P)-dependent dehydrogenase (short-subunit alcohol dehydrogenase family)
MAERWTAEDVPDLTGRLCVVTGGNSGLGLETARGLARRGATVVIACRDPGRARVALDDLRESAPAAEIDAMPLDLASLASIRAFAEAFLARHPRLDVLCNNAGVMALPYRETADGFEMQLGTNHLGHFALTGLLLPALLAAPGARVVNVSSSAHRAGRMRFDDLHGKRGYRKWPAYAQSKLANLLFTHELARRAAARGLDLTVAASHPGYAATNLQAASPRMSGSALGVRIMELGNRLFAQSAAMGALPTLYAATAPDVQSGDYFGPGGFIELWGHPTRVQPIRRARDPEAAERLWRVSEELTGVRFSALGA